MLRLPVVDSALEGFRITRERPLAVAVWALWLFVGAVLGEALLTVPAMQELARLAQTPPGELRPVQLAAIGVAAGRAWPAILAWTAVGYVSGVVVYTAVLRAVLEPAARGHTFYLRLGADEARQLGLALIVLAILLGFAMAVQLLTALAAAAGPVAGPPAAAFVLAAAVAAMAVAVLRLSLAPAATFAARRIRLFDTWKLTKGTALRLLGVYATALALAAVIYFLAMVIVAALTFTVAAATGGGAAAVPAMVRPDTSSLTALFSPPSLFAMVLQAAVGMPIWVVTWAAGVAAYRRIAAARSEPGAL